MEVTQEVLNQLIFSMPCNQDVVSMFFFSIHPGEWEHLGNALMSQECLPINRAADRAAGVSLHLQHGGEKQQRRHVATV